MDVNKIVYKRIDIKTVKNAYKNATKRVLNAKSVDDIVLARKSLLKTLTDLNTYYSVAYVRWSLNTKDEFYFNEKRYYEENIPSLIENKHAYIRAILGSEFKSELEKVVPKTLFPLYECELKSADVTIEELLIKESEAVQEYSNFMSGLTVNFNGEEIPFTLLKKYMSSEQRSERKKAYNVIGKKLKENAKFLDGNFDELVKIRNAQAVTLGYENYVDLAYYNRCRIGYTQKDVLSMRENVKKYIVPLVSKIREEIAKDVNIKDLKIYDMDKITKGKSVEPKYKGEELLLQGAKLYKNISKDTFKFYKSMVKNNAFDYESRPNKWGGGYEIELSKFNQPFILANFNGSLQDVDVLTHEFGHAYASYNMLKNKCDIEVGLPFMEIAETHSMSMEFFCYKNIEKLFGRKANKYKFSHLVDAFTFLCYGCMVDEFQETVYKNPNLTPKERKDLWLSLEKTYRPFFDNKGVTYFENGGRWQYQMHIYETPFYYIDYVMAQFIAFEFLILSLNDYEGAFNKYCKFISFGCDLSFTELLNECNLNSPFNEETVKEIGEKICEIIYKIKNEK